MCLEVSLPPQDLTFQKVLACAEALFEWRSGLDRFKEVLECCPDITTDGKLLKTEKIFTIMQKSK